MFELVLILAVFVMAVVAINKANGAIRENAALRLELERIRFLLERKPAFSPSSSMAPHCSSQASEWRTATCA